MAITARCGWLNSPDGQKAIQSRARHYSDGLLKLEPRDYMAVPIPAALGQTDHTGDQVS